MVTSENAQMSGMICLEFSSKYFSQEKVEEYKRTDETNVAEAPYWNRVIGGDALYNSLLLRMIENV